MEDYVALEMEGWYLDGYERVLDLDLYIFLNPLDMDLLPRTR